jgi:hypothetical protein
MECYEGAKMIKTFRGMLPGSDTGSVDTIVLHTNTGETGYKIHNLQLIQQSPGAANCEGLVIVWKVSPTAAQIAAKTINFNDNTILAVGFYSANTASQTYPEDMTIIFDREIFNQDIYLTYIDVATANDDMNYYIELEQIKLDLSESTVATLKDIRNEHRIPPG